MSERKPTIWQALADRLGREPTHAEACAEVRRILSEGAAGLRINGTSDIIASK